MSTAMATIEDAGVTIDHQAILKSLNLDVRLPATQALLLVCERYGLDPLLKHMVLISGNPYITRDGYLAIAHRSGVFDGMEVLEQGSDGSHFTAKVSVYRKDMGRPFTFIGRYPKAQRMAKEYGPEMAVKVAEVQALRRAFNVTGVGAADERWDADVQVPEADNPVADASRRIAAALPPSNVDASTGEVVDTPPAPKKRKPPTGIGGVGTAAPEKPKVELATPEQVADVTMHIDNLKACGENWLTLGRTEWKNAGIPAVPASRLSQDDAAKAFEVLDRVFLLAKTQVAPTLDGES